MIQAHLLIVAEPSHYVTYEGEAERVIITEFTGITHQAQQGGPDGGVVFHRML